MESVDIGESMSIEKNHAHIGPVWRFLRRSDVQVPWKKPLFEPYEKKGGAV